MTPPRDPLYRHHRFRAEVIGYAVWLYFRFPLSLRMVEDVFAPRGIKVSDETVRNRAKKFGRNDWHMSSKLRSLLQGDELIHRYQ